MMYEQIIFKQKNGQIGLSREEEIFMILLHFLKDPALTDHFMIIFRECVFADSMNFHLSLRRWGRGIVNLYRKKQDILSWSQAVPLSCAVPITVDKWRNFKKIKEDIGFFYKGFIAERVSEDGCVDIISFKRRIRIVNHTRKFIKTKIMNSDSLNLSLRRHINGENGSVDVDDYGGLIVDFRNENSGYLIL